VGLYSLFGQVPDPRSIWVIARPRCALSALQTARSRALTLVLARAASARFRGSAHIHLLQDLKESSKERFLVNLRPEEAEAQYSQGL
jgi:hypothetical protein